MKYRDFMDPGEKKFVSVTLTIAFYGFIVWVLLLRPLAVVLGRLHHGMLWQ